MMNASDMLKDDGSDLASRLEAMATDEDFAIEIGH
jgi:hypothetical protein